MNLIFYAKNIFHSILYKTVYKNILRCMEGKCRSRTRVVINTGLCTDQAMGQSIRLARVMIINLKLTVGSKLLTHLVTQTIAEKRKIGVLEPFLIAIRSHDHIAVLRSFPNQ